MITTCNTYNSNKIIFASENGKRFNIINNNSRFVNKVKVDNCYQTVGKKCDYLFEIMSQECKNTLTTVYYVELKGCRLDDALEQLISTINHCNSMHKSVCRIAVAVLSRVPRQTTGIQKMKVKISKLTKSVPIIKNNIVEIKI